MFFVRAVENRDLPALGEVARHLDSVNLPNDEQRLGQIVERSERSFAGKLDPSKRELLFVLVEAPEGGGAERVVGASMIFAQHGNRAAPHVYFDVFEEERYSETLDRHFRHTVLRIGYNYRGLTEVGGLVLRPEYRGRPEQLGKLIGYTRFLYIGLHREVFRDEIVSELMPPLEPDGTSVLWEALGRNFTGLGYLEADRLSRENKEFIRSLFPQDPIYATLLPPRAQALIGEVGPSTKAVERMLRRIGFRYAHRIDPFDGGPHFHARTDEVTLVKASRKAAVRELAAAEPSPAASAGPPVANALVAAESAGAPFFKAVRTNVFLLTDGVVVGAEAAAALGVRTGDTVGLLPLEPGLFAP